MTAPAVAIALSAKDNAAFLPQAMDTLLAQTFGDFELIAVDDGSSDATWEILQGFAARDPRVTPVRNETNIGLAASLNRILAIARAPLIARADGDDVYHPERLARQVAFMAANPKIGVLSCGYRRIDAGGRVLETVRPVNGPDRIRMHYFFRNPILHPGVMMRADVVRAAGGYDESYRKGQDTELWARLLPVTRFEIDQDALVDWRLHAGATMASKAPDAFKVGHEIRQRLISDYIGRAVSFDETFAVFGLCRQYHPRTPEETWAAEAVLRAIARAALRREPLSAVLDFRTFIARTLNKEAARGPALRARRLYAASLRWRPTRTAAVGFARAALGR